MTRYHLGAKAHCCCCASGVLCTLLGISLLSTGVAMILDYGKFDVSMLPPGWRNSDGQRNLGIILTTLAVTSLILGVVVSVLFFTVCNRGPAELPDSQPEKVPGTPPPTVVVTVTQPPDLPPLERPADRDSHRHRKHHKHRRKHSKKSRRQKEAIRLETHLEAAEEQDGLSSREHSARKRANSLSRREQRPLQPLDPRLLQTRDSLREAENSSEPPDRDSDEADFHRTRHLPLLLIAPASETFSTCDSLECSSVGTGDTDPYPFRSESVGTGDTDPYPFRSASVSSLDNSSIVTSASTQEPFRPYYNAREEMVQLDRQLSDVLK